MHTLVSRSRRQPMCCVKGGFSCLEAALGAVLDDAVAGGDGGEPSSSAWILAGGDGSAQRQRGALRPATERMGKRRPLDGCRRRWPPRTVSPTSAQIWAWIGLAGPRGSVGFRGAWTGSPPPDHGDGWLGRWFRTQCPAY